MRADFLSLSETGPVLCGLLLVHKENGIRWPLLVPLVHFRALVTAELNRESTAYGLGSATIPLGFKSLWTPLSVLC